eukprot:3763768-Pyramimonas_sp.AAC.1
MALARSTCLIGIRASMYSSWSSATVPSALLCWCTPHLQGASPCSCISAQVMPRRSASSTSTTPRVNLGRRAASKKRGRCNAHFAVPTNVSKAPAPMSRKPLSAVRRRMIPAILPSGASS